MFNQMIPWYIAE